MIFQKFKVTFLFLFLFQSLTAVSQDYPDDLINHWHKSAAEADFKGYFKFFASDSSIFLGTDAKERWSKQEFIAFSKPYFDSGKAWEFIPVERYWQGNLNSGTIYFHEILDSKHMGVCRGSGVLILIDGHWKLDFYNLSLLVPNELVEQLQEMIEQSPNE